MDKDEAELAQRAIAALNAMSKGSERSQQANEFRVGISDLGHCQEFTRRQILQEPMTDERQYLEAFIGTAVGDHAERAIAEATGYRRHTQVFVELEGDQGGYRLEGHPDLLGDDIVIDLKTAAGLEKVRRTGPTQQQLFQRHLYALGAHQLGLLTVPLEAVRTANIWFDRSGADHTAFCHIDAFNPDVVKAATAWLDDVVYAVKHGEEAMREPAREFCERYCPRFTACRALDTDVRGLLTDPDVLAAVDIYREAGEMEKRAHTLRNEAQIALKGVSGSTGEYTVRWVNIPEGHVSYDRRGYMRLSIARAKVKG